MMLRLPVPPSANKLYANRRRSTLEFIAGKPKGRGRFKTREYQNWIQEAGWRLKMQRPPSFTGWVEVEIWLPDSSGLDLDNATKPTIDLLVRHQVIPNDHKKFVRRIVLNWTDQGPDLQLGIRTIDNPEARVTAARSVA